ncbi:LysR family transcriptional regulator [Pelosinus sp. UFO1]|uniref:LysR family transcriptional regulator n=1 Tax=Pelosinus sp. UFO1 TaxID=484770 RepID=UPI00056EE355|nr:LysR substrate-binding domain-containing protein [Pelosinus sp. UFO1]
MELRHLEYFMTMYKELHFTKAAEKLGISQPTLSQQIRILESEVDALLFDRVGKKVLVTQAGEILYQHCLQIFGELKQAHTAIGELQGLERGSLAVGCSGSHLLISSIVKFHTRYPGIKFSIVQLSTEEIKEKLLKNELDIGIAFLPLDDLQLATLYLYAEELCLAVCKKNELSKQKSVNLDMLKSIPIVLLPPKYIIRQFIDHATEELGFLFNPIIEMMPFEHLLEIVGRNIAVTILPRSYINSFADERIQTVSIANPAMKKEMGLIYRKDRFLSAATDKFIEELVLGFKDFHF